MSLSSGLPLPAALRSTYVRYGLASVVALGADVGLFLMLLRAGLPSVTASACGYGFGLVVHWIISSRFVFTATTARFGRARRRQQALFLGSALVGLLLTMSIVALGNFFGLLPIVAKLAAIVVSFQATYVLRKAVVFTA